MNTVAGANRMKYKKRGKQTKEQSLLLHVHHEKINRTNIARGNK